MNPCPKPVKRSTVKRRKRVAKNANIAQVRRDVMDRDGLCRLMALLYKFGIPPQFIFAPELAHLKARGMGGNPDLSRDTTANTIWLTKHLHTGARSHHSGHLQIRPLTDRGADGPVCFELYEQLPTEAK